MKYAAINPQNPESQKILAIAEQQERAKRRKTERIAAEQERQRIKKAKHDKWMATANHEEIKHKQLLRLTAQVNAKSMELRRRCPNVDFVRFEQNMLKRLKKEHGL